MATKTVSEQVLGELEGEGRKYQGVRLNLVVREMFVDESSLPIARAIARTELSPTHGLAVENGAYTLRFNFDGKLEQHAVRVAGGTLLAA